MAVPLELVPCQYHVIPSGAELEEEMITPAGKHLGESLSSPVGAAGKEFTVSVMLFEVAVVLVTQPFVILVISQVITSLSAGVDKV